METPELLQPREKVTAKNELFRLRAKESNILASRIFMGFATLVTPEDVEKGMSKLVSIPASSVLTNYQGGKQYADLKKAAHFLVGKTLERKTPKGGFEVFALFSSIKYEDGVLTGRIDSSLLPFFLAAKHHAGLFTKLDYQAYIKLSSIYSQKLFAFLSSWGDCRVKVIPLDELHDLLQTPKTQRANFSEFNRRALSPAHKDITENTPLNFSWEAVKIGRKVTAIKFTFKEKPLALPTEKDRTRDIDKLRKGMSKSMSSKTPEEGNTGGQCMAIARPCFQEHGGKCAEELHTKEVCDYCRNVLQKAPHLFLRLEQTSLV